MKWGYLNETPSRRPRSSAEGKVQQTTTLASRMMPPLVTRRAFPGISGLSRRLYQLNLSGGIVPKGAHFQFRNYSVEKGSLPENEPLPENGSLPETRPLFFHLPKLAKANSSKDTPRKPLTPQSKVVRPLLVENGGRWWLGEHLGISSLERTFTFPSFEKAWFSGDTIHFCCILDDNGVVTSSNNAAGSNPVNGMDLTLLRVNPDELFGQSPTTWSCFNVSLPFIHQATDILHPAALLIGNPLTSCL
ncbi:hypothetical protein B0H67DRAFT_252043 [Lasiosphaeris hirsuta]|uniref:Uncharacterized protein n=1 Tax=Lasiosphaeris hirsuta TaxID=260670 RepID=A0AA40DUA3_9PEZI|nr:hypothetical protein B0H67DRAFT_252043 [Lasiosphaeris hirsuta]